MAIMQGSVFPTAQFTNVAYPVEGGVDLYGSGGHLSRFLLDVPHVTPVCFRFWVTTLMQRITARIVE